ncbi:MAG: FHA domain-containing protein [Coriobacteriales bacterium]
MSVTCPICNESLSPGMACCPRCGFTLTGATEAFQPVSSEQRAAACVPVLKVVKGPYNGQEFAMREGSFTIGRDPSCDLFLNNMTVSRLHATITITGDSAKIVDENSLNGTWVNGAVVEQAPLSSGSTVQIGTFEMVFQRKPL